MTITKRKNVIKKLLILALCLMVINIILISYNISKISKIESINHGSLITFTDGTDYYIEK